MRSRSGTARHVRRPDYCYRKHKAASPHDVTRAFLRMVRRPCINTCCRMDFNCASGSPKIGETVLCFFAPHRGHDGRRCELRDGNDVRAGSLAQPRRRRGLRLRHPHRSGNRIRRPFGHNWKCEMSEPHKPWRRIQSSGRCTPRTKTDYADQRRHRDAVLVLDRADLRTPSTCWRSADGTCRWTYCSGPLVAMSASCVHAKAVKRHCTAIAIAKATGSQL
jgi:hypothetical protein